MRILLLAHSFNSLTQRLWVELAGRGHDLSVEFDVHDRVTEEAVALFRPELIVAPFLKRRIPDTVWRRNRCLVVHPGIRGDRGPSALDWAIMNGETRVGRHCAGGERRDGRRRRLGRMSLPDAGGDEEQPLPERGHGSGTRGAHPGARADRTRGGTGTARLRRLGGARTRASADAPGRSRDRLAGRRYGDRAAQDPRGRRRSRRARRRARRACVSLRRAPRIVAAVRRGGSRRHRRAARRRRPPRDDRRRSVDHPPQALERRAGGVQAACGQGAGGSARRCPGNPARTGGDGRGRDVAADPLRGARRHRLAALRLLQRRDGDRPVRTAARRVPLRDDAPDPSHCPRRRARLLVERDPPEPDRGFGASGRGIVAKHQRDRRPRSRDRRRGPPADDRGDAGQRGCRRRVPRARGRSRLRARRDRAQSALQGDGQSLRIRVLDLPLAAAPGCRTRAGDHGRTGFRSALARRRRSGSSTRASARRLPRSWPKSKRACGS